MEEINFIIQRGLWDSKKRRLTIAKDFIHYEDELTPAKPFSRFEKDEITEFRFGINWIRGFEFTIGREYQFFIRNTNNKILKIYFKSFYGIKKSESHKLYSEIFAALWEFHFSKMSNELLNKFHKGEEIGIGNLNISIDGINFNTSRGIKGEMKTIPWEKIGTKNYHTYFSIFSIDDPSKFNNSFSYLKDWNTGVIYSVVRSILKEKNLIQA